MIDELKLRRATYDDVHILFDWTNDVEVRRNSFNSKTITWDEHVDWFNNVMADSDRFLYILEINGDPGGMVRLDIFESRDKAALEAEVSYSIASKYRGRGYGKRILEMVENEIRKESISIGALVAKVKPDNVKSIKTFLNADYSEEYVVMKKTLHGDIGLAE